MSVSVLFALVDAETFKNLNPAEVDEVTTALIREIDSDPALKQRLTDAVSDSAAKLIAAKKDPSVVGGE